MTILDTAILGNISQENCYLYMGMAVKDVIMMEWIKPIVITLIICFTIIAIVKIIKPKDDKESKGDD